MPTSPPAMTRLWFHLDDVLPLAAHAMACTRHAVTSAQVLGVAPLRPALIWHGDDAHDTLASNGLPGWHDHTGQAGSARDSRHQRLLSFDSIDRLSR